MATIHETATVHPTAILGDNVLIGANVQIGAYCLIGLAPESIGNLDKNCGVVIEEGTILTGHVTIDGGVEAPTWIGAGCFLMKHAHIGHDCVLGSEVVIAPNAVVGGHCKVRSNVGIGMNASIHQRLTIPQGCFIGAGCVLPRTWEGQVGMKYVGNPARCIGQNVRK